MNKLNFGIFGLFILAGSYFGSTFGIAVAVCVFMIADGIKDEFKKQKSNKINKTTKEGK